MIPQLLITEKDRKSSLLAVSVHSGTKISERGSEMMKYLQMLSHPGTDQARPAELPRSREIGRVQGCVAGDRYYQRLTIWL